MRVCIKNGKISGEIKAIASKSAAHRILICSSFADKVTEVAIRELSDDISATADCLKALGAKIDLDQNGFRVTPIEKTESRAVLNCRESGSTLRFLLPVAGILGTETDFVLSGRLPDRPLSPLWESMEQHGCSLSKPERKILHLEGKLGAGKYNLAANVSSQFISGLLFALPMSNGESVIKLEGKLESAGYIDLTRAVQERFGVKTCFDGDEIKIPTGKYKSPGKIDVEGDWSNAAFWLCAGAISDGGVTCRGLDMSSTQGDRRIVEILKMFGAVTEILQDSVTVKPSDLNGIEFDASDIPDLVPVMSAVACAAKGRTVIKGASRLRLKECDRLAAVTEVLSSLGAEIKEMSDGLEIYGKGTLSGGRVKSYGDHRIPMTAAIASSICQGEVLVDGAQEVSKSYPAFWKDFEGLGAYIEYDFANNEQESVQN